MLYNFTLRNRVMNLIRCAKSPHFEGHQAAKELRALGMDALPHVVRILLKGSPDDQVSAAGALILLNSKEAVEPLLLALKSPHAPVRSACIRTLSFLRDARAIKPFIHLLDDPDHAVRQDTMRALGYLGVTEALEPLLQALEHEDWEIRKSAASSLGWLADVRSLDALHAHLFDKSKRVRKSVKFALAQIHLKTHQKN